MIQEAIHHFIQHSLNHLHVSLPKQFPSFCVRETRTNLFQIKWVISNLDSSFIKWAALFLSQSEIRKIRMKENEILSRWSPTADWGWHIIKTRARYSHRSLQLSHVSLVTDLLLLRTWICWVFWAQLEKATLARAVFMPLPALGKPKWLG